MTVRLGATCVWSERLLGSWGAKRHPWLQEGSYLQGQDEAAWRSRRAGLQWGPQGAGLEAGPWRRLRCEAHTGERSRPTPRLPRAGLPVAGTRPAERAFVLFWVSARFGDQGSAFRTLGWGFLVGPGDGGRWAEGAEARGGSDLGIFSKEGASKARGLEQIAQERAKIRDHSM